MVLSICGKRLQFRTATPSAILILIGAIAFGYFITITICQRACDNSQHNIGNIRQMLGRDVIDSDPHLPHTFLIVFIYTQPKDERLRQTIRDTWLKLSARGADVWRYYFPIGKKSLPMFVIEALEKEQSAKSDLLLVDNLEEGYAKLTQKTVAVFQKSISLVRFSYLLKVDGDSFVRIGVLLKALKDIEHPRLYWGFIDGRAPVIRKGKWQEREWKLCDRYLPYACGGGYVLSHDLVKYITNNVRYLKMYNSEDVSIGAWLGGLNVHYVHDPRFDTEWTSRGCNNQFLITHKQTEADLHRLYELITSTGNLCQLEYKKRGSYIYDWSVAPSQCCARTNDTKIP